MKIILGSDHAGFENKELIKQYLTMNNYEIVDMGTDSKESTDYTDYAIKVGEAIVKDVNALGIVVCGTGIGVSIACNKVKHIRCAKVSCVEESKLARLHNDANVLALSSKMNEGDIKECVNAFIKTPFSNEERHIRRISKITKYEDNHEY